jgi:hypothetical protein
MASATKVLGPAWEAEVKLRTQSFDRLQPKVRPAVEREAVRAKRSRA